jgi:predicted ABC-type ATPase
MVSGSLLLLAGPNGAGKSTLANHLVLRKFVEGYRKLNADERTLELVLKAGYAGFADVPEDRLREFFVTAANETYDQAVDDLRSGLNVCLETVLSTDKYCSLVSEVRRSGGKFGLLYVALNSPSISQQRIAARVVKGGHPVPLDRLVERWQRSLRFLPWFLSRADFFMVFDNSFSNPEIASLLVAEGSFASGRWGIDAARTFSELREILSGCISFEPSSTASDLPSQ